MGGNNSGTRESETDNYKSANNSIKRKNAIQNVAVLVAADVLVT